MNLYLDQPKEKSMFKMAAFAARVSEKPENWPQELTSEIMRQLPYLSDYDLNVNLQTVDPQRGFAFGYGDVSSKTERPEVEHAELGVPHIRIPLIIEDRAVRPFNVFLDGERVVPLTEDRVRQTLFNPQSFDLSSSAPRDPSLVESLMPPTRTGPGMGGEYKVASVMVKEALSPATMASAVSRGSPAFGQRVLSRLEGRVQRAYQAGGSSAGMHALQKKLPVSEAFQRRGMSGPSGTQVMRSPVTKTVAIGGPPQAAQSHPATRVSRPPAAPEQGHSGYTSSTSSPGYKLVFSSALLSEIAGTIKKADAEGFISKVASDANLIAGFRKAGVAQQLVSIFDNIRETTAEEQLYKIASAIQPTVATFLKLPGGDFIVKTAATDAFAGGPQAQGQVVPQQEAAEAIGPQNAQAMQPGQTATAVANPVPAMPPEESNDKLIDEFGQWMVQDTMGNKLTGWVFPQTLAWDGSFSPQPMALFTNGSSYAFQEQMSGELVGKSTTLPSDPPRGDGVFYTVQGGKAISTQPIMIGSSMAGPDGQPKFVGTDVFGNHVEISMAEGLSSPTRVSDVEYAFPPSWKFMRLNNQTQLVSDPVQMNKAASVRAEGRSVELLYNGSYHLRGGCGLDKIASEFRYDLDPVSAEFMLGVLGVDGISSKAKLAEARKKGVVKIAGLHQITTLSERYSQKVKEASAILSSIPDLRVDLIKEAADLEDAGTVNNVLALNFINPENLHTFINYIPELEMTSERLAEMWLYSIMGMNELPGDSIERAMKNMEKVVEGLKAIAHAEA